MSERTSLCGHFFKKGPNQKQFQYICDDWRHCKRCFKRRLDREKASLTTYFRQPENMGKPILLKTFTGSEAEQRASNFTLKLRRAGASFRRYPLTDKVLVLHDHPLDPTAEDILYSQVMSNIEAWLLQPVGKNISGKLGLRPKKVREGELVNNWLWKTNAPSEIEDAIQAQAKEVADKKFGQPQTVATWNAYMALFEQVVRSLLYETSFCLNFSYHVKEYKVLTKNIDISLLEPERFEVYRT